MYHARAVTDLTLFKPSQRATFAGSLRASWRRTGAFLCIGLDPLPARFPLHLRDSAVDLAVARFCTEIVDGTAHLACAFKPQVAHFAALGLEGLLADLIAHIHSKHPEVPVILDAKRGDIGSTAELYAREAFERFDADAVTVNPFLGPESVQPFLDYPGRGTLVLCRTSNPDSAWLQSEGQGADPVYLRIARQAVRWNALGREKGSVMLVAGATYPEELGAIRDAADEVGLLVPGVGAQGADLATVFHQGATTDGFGLAVNSSRGILYAGQGEDYVEVATATAEAMVAQMRALRHAANLA